MNHARGGYRPFVRQGNVGNRSRSLAADLIRGAGVEAVRTPSSLVSSAGAIGTRQAIEALEQRKLLFSLTITPSDVGADGIGQVPAFFGYTIPYLFPSVEAGDATQDPTVVLENFDDEADTGALNSPTTFLESTIRLQHNILPASRIQIDPQIVNGVPSQNENWLEVLFQSGDFIQFNNQGSGGMVTFQMEVDDLDGDGIGFDVFNTTLEAIGFDGLGNQVVIHSETGAELANRFAGGNAGTGQFTFTLPNDVVQQRGPVFTDIRFRSNGGLADFAIDNVQTTHNPVIFADIVESRIFGAEAVFSGPVGASIQFLDLYGNDLTQTIGMGIPEGSQSGLTGVDPDDDGIPNFNDGIGQIIIRNADSRTSLTMWGGTIVSFAQDAPADADFVQGNFAYIRSEAVAGQFDDFEAAGFGYVGFADGQGAVETVGLPQAGGAVIIGAPADLVRDRSSAVTYNAAGFSPNMNPAFPVATNGFTEAGQGLLIEGSSFGTLSINGALHGSTRFTGSVDRIIVGSLVGSIAVNGDLGSLVVATDAGLWEIDVDANNVSNIDVLTVNNTAAELTVGRTVGEIFVGGRSLMDVTVVGDLNDPNARPPREVLRYIERERILAIDPGIDNGIEIVLQAMLNNTNVAGINGIDGTFVTTAGASLGQPTLFGGSLFRNDSILSSEFVGSISSSVQIFGNLGAQDPVNTSEDPSDIFAFAVDGSRTVNVQLDTNIEARIVDVDGRTLAAMQAPRRANDTLPFAFKFDAPAPGVYYLVLSENTNGNEDINATYAVTMTGLAPTVLGAYRTGAGFGVADFPDDAATINVLSGAVGQLRIGSGLIGSDGGETDPTSFVNSNEDDLGSLLTWRAAAVNVPGNLYDITTGSDINTGSNRGQVSIPVQVFVGGNFGQLHTGMSPQADGGSTGTANPSGLEGDVSDFTLNVGGSIAVLDIRGGIGISQDGDTNPPPAALRNLPVIISTGLNGGDGNIGLINVGSHILASEFKLQTPAGSTIGGILVSQFVQDVAGDFFGIQGNDISIFTGSGSDIRFVDFTQIDGPANVNATLPIIGGQTLEIIDDSGGKVFIDVVGGATGVTFGQVRVLPIDGSQGVAIGQIVMNDISGTRLNIRSEGTNGVVSIGRIIINNSDRSSSIRFEGEGEIDVWRIEQFAGGALERIENLTPNGDIVAIDVLGVDRVLIASGSLGSTELPAWGPKFIGPHLGLASGLDATVGGALGIDATTVEQAWAGGIFAPVERAAAGPVPFLDDMGSPFDGYLNGLVVRTGNIFEVRAGGSIGDVILQGGDITNIEANSDGQLRFGFFDGITGSIYANNIQFVEVGEGLIGLDDSPMARAGIFANDDIRNVVGFNTPGAFISGAVVAANNIPGEANAVYVSGYDGARAETFEFIADELDGVGRVELEGGGDFIDLYLAGSFLDDFWNSNASVIDTGAFLGEVFNLTGRNADLFRSVVSGARIRNINLQDGFFDASQLRTSSNIDAVTAMGYRNSTLTGGNLEFRRNQIVVNQDLVSLTTIGDAGDISDLFIDVRGNVTDRITGRNITRVSINVDNNIALVQAFDNMRGSEVVAGSLNQLTVDQKLQSSSFTLSGRINQVTVGDRISNTSFEVTGPDGSIGTIVAQNLLSGSITASGAIERLESLAGDIDATITTTTALGSVNQIIAARDLNITTDISQGLTSLIAGRHIGSINEPRVILVRGNLESVDASSGQIYSDIRVGEAITGTIAIGQVVSKPTNDLVSTGSITAFGPISFIDIEGDFNGDIISYTGGIDKVTITNGSFLPDNLIAAYDGDINSIVITNGHLLGNIHADYSLNSLRVVGSANGVFGDIGINQNLKNTTAVDGMRNQLPPGILAATGVQGPTISARFNIGSIEVTNGSIFESAIYAGRAIGTISVNGNISNDGQSTGLISNLGSVIAAGSFIDTVTVTGFVINAAIVSGVADLGADGRAGGIGVNADTMQAGSINKVSIGGAGVSVYVVAGITSGNDGLYQTSDDQAALGLSTIGSVSTGSASNVFAIADTSIGATSSGIVRGGTGRPVNDSQVLKTETTGTAIANGVATPFAINGNSGTITITGPGTARLDAANNRITLQATTGATNVTINSTSGVFNDFNIVSFDDASIGTLQINTSLSGDSDIVIDGNANAIFMGNHTGTGDIRIGGTLGSLITGAFTGGFVNARILSSASINGNFGVVNQIGEAEIHARVITSIKITGNNSGLIDAQQSIESLAVTGDLALARVRAGDTIGSITAAAASQSWISARDTITSFTVAGDFFDSILLVGGDLGSDGAFGGTGDNADTATTGFLGSVMIGGGFGESDIIAGSLRGNDKFFGTGDDIASEGRSTIDSITIGTNNVGSSFGSESYRISSTGTLGTLLIGGNPGRNQGNFAIEDKTDLGYQPLPIQIVDVTVKESAQRYTATLFFNQPIDASTLGSALQVRELRSIGDVTIRLMSGLDYTLTYNSALNAAEILFNSSVTSADLPLLTGVPTAGVYRFDLDQNIIRAALVNARLDGNNDGLVTSGDNFRGRNIVGDAGDRLTSSSVTINDAFTNQPITIDFFSPINLDVVLDSSQTPDGVLDPNQTFTVRGSIGDHPDHDVNIFKFASDVDVYSLTLQAGQILRLGKMEGGALLAFREILDADGNILHLQGTGGETGLTTRLPSVLPETNEITSEDVILVKQTGTYYIAVSNAPGASTLSSIVNIAPVPGGLGDYSFTVEVFDDGNTGFAAGSDAGNGDVIVNAPSSIDFSGLDRIFGTADDISTLNIGQFSFTLNAGADGIKGSIDDVITGDNGQGITSSRTAGSTLTSTVQSSIGPAASAGVPTTIFADADVYHLNNGSTIKPGTRMRATVKLLELGSDIGSRSQDNQLIDQSGNVQFALFDTTNATGVSDASLIFAPSDFSPNGSTPGIIADNGTTSYGYDANGEFFIDFLVPANSAGADGSFGTADDIAGSFAFYLQGAFRSDYILEIVTSSQGIFTPVSQNIFIETRGGTVDWLEAGGRTTSIPGFTTQGLGFSGEFNNQPVDQYVVSQLVTNLQNAFDLLGVNVTISTNVSDFEFEPFSTVFLSDSDDPINSLLDPVGGTGANQRFGYSEHSDPFNTDLNDEAVVFMDSLSLLGFTPSQADVDLFSQSLTAAVGRRVGELMGLRLTNGGNTLTDPFDITAANSVVDVPSASDQFSYPTLDNLLSGRFDSIGDTDFFLGSQNSGSLLDQFLANN